MRDYFKAAPSTGYETLIYDCMIGDAMLFQRADNIEAGWAPFSPCSTAGQRRQRGRHLPAGSSGPSAADALLAADGFQWLPLT